MDGFTVADIASRFGKKLNRKTKGKKPSSESVNDSRASNDNSDPSSVPKLNFSRMKVSKSSSRSESKENELLKASLNFFNYMLGVIDTDKKKQNQNNHTDFSAKETAHENISHVEDIYKLENIEDAIGLQPASIALPTLLPNANHFDLQLRAASVTKLSTDMSNSLIPSQIQPIQFDVGNSSNIPLSENDENLMDSISDLIRRSSADPFSWVEHSDPVTGEVYYLNSITNERKAEKPVVEKVIHQANESDETVSDTQVSDFKTHTITHNNDKSHDNNEITDMKSPPQSKSVKIFRNIINDLSKILNQPGQLAKAIGNIYQLLRAKPALAYDFLEAGGIGAITNISLFHQFNPLIKLKVWNILESIAAQSLNALEFEKQERNGKHAKKIQVVLQAIRKLQMDGSSDLNTMPLSMLKKINKILSLDLSSSCVKLALECLQNIPLSGAHMNTVKDIGHTLIYTIKNENIDPTVLLQSLKVLTTFLPYLPGKELKAVSCAKHLLSCLHSYNIEQPLFIEGISILEQLAKFPSVRRELRNCPPVIKNFVNKQIKQNAKSTTLDQIANNSANAVITSHKKKKNLESILVKSISVEQKYGSLGGHHYRYGSYKARNSKNISQKQKRAVISRNEIIFDSEISSKSDPVFSEDLLKTSSMKSILRKPSFSIINGKLRTEDKDVLLLLWNIFTYYSIRWDVLRIGKIAMSDFLCLLKDSKILIDEQYIKKNAHKMDSAAMNQIPMSSCKAEIFYKKTLYSRNKQPQGDMTFVDFLNALLVIAQESHIVNTRKDNRVARKGAVHMAYILKNFILCDSGAKRRKPADISLYLEDDILKLMKSETGRVGKLFRRLYKCYRTFQGEQTTDQVVNDGFVEINDSNAHFGWKSLLTLCRDCGLMVHFSAKDIADIFLSCIQIQDDCYEVSLSLGFDSFWEAMLRFSVMLHDGKTNSITTSVQEMMNYMCGFVHVNYNNEKTLKKNLPIQKRKLLVLNFFKDALLV